MTIPLIEPYQITAMDVSLSSRVSWKPDPKRCVLLVHDMQEYFLNFFTPDSSPIPQLLSNIEKLLKTARSLNMPVIYTAQPDNQSPKDRGVLQDFWGSGINDAAHLKPICQKISPLEGEILLTKWRYSAFKRTSLQEYMEKNQKDQIIICGIYAHIGCLLTASEAFMLDIQPFFITDAVADFSYEKHKMAVEYVNSCCAVAIPTAEAINHLETGL